MSQAPRQIHAQIGQLSKAGARPRWLPIVVVPGFMGSRLVDPAEKKLVWNPLGFPTGDDGGNFSADAEKLMDMSTELEPDEDHKFKFEDERHKVRRIRHVYNCVSGRYLPLLEKLDEIGARSTAKAAECHGVRARVYVAGYDWRQDVAKSAARLARVVDDALRETGAPRVIVIAHSLGTLVARYYSRVLGGEAKVHRMVLLGAMIHGVPEAYVQLKGGLVGLYEEDIRHATDGASMVSNIANATMTVGSTVASLQRGNVLSGLTGLVGDIYLALCLGSAKLFTRAEVIRIVRRMLPPYQMLPTAIYCDQHRHWLMFDPLATGYSPAGSTVRFPFAMQAVGDISVGIANAVQGAAGAAGEEIRRGLDTFLGREAITSRRATVNAPTVPELFEHASREAAEGKPEAPIQAIRELSERLEATFLDCRSPSRLYHDIYTGLMDNPELRAVSAANLAIAERTQRALIENYREEEPLTARSLLEPFLGPFSTALMRLADVTIGAAIAGAGKDTTRAREVERRRTEFEVGEREERERREREREEHPRAYVHPRTVNVYVDTEPTTAGCWVVATDVVPKHDHNIVKWEMSPNLIADAMLLAAAGGSTGMAANAGALGDDRIPIHSTNPAPETMTAPFLATHCAPHVSHGDLAKEESVVTYIVEQIDASIADYCKLF